MNGSGRTASSHRMLHLFAALAAAVMLWAAWCAIPSSSAPPALPGGTNRWSVELMFGYTRGLLPLTLSLLLLWYAAAGGRALERRRIGVTLKVALVLGTVMLGGVFVLYTIIAIANDNNLGPIVGVIMAVIAAPATLFIAALAGFAYSRYRIRPSDVGEVPC
jgi:hypothetical protein